MSRETTKTIELSGRKFKIDKFDALTGSYIAFTLIEKFLPMAMEKKIGLSNMPKGRQLMTRAEFTQLQKDCLGVVYEILPAGPRPILNKNGSWGVMDIEKDTVLVIMLTVQALEFNVASFFDADRLKDLQNTFAGLIPASMQIFKDTPTPP